VKTDALSLGLVLFIAGLEDVRNFLCLEINLGSNK
jgi:hypothetical protein